MIVVALHKQNNKQIEILATETHQLGESNCGLLQTTGEPAATAAADSTDVTAADPKSKEKSCCEQLLVVTGSGNRTGSAVLGLAATRSGSSDVIAGVLV